MGSCFCRDNSTVDVVPGPRVSLADSGMTEDSPASVSTPPTSITIEEHILEMVELIGNDSQAFNEQPDALLKLLAIAEDANGWKNVVETMIDTVPLDQPLGPSAIAIIFDDCPLPAVNTVHSTMNSFGLSRHRALSCNGSVDYTRRERNMLVVLGCMAEKFAGPVCGKLLTQEVRDYLYVFLIEKQKPELVLYAVLAIEKFAKTKESKDALLEFFELHVDTHPLMSLEHYCNSDDLMWRQVGFCARWLLDNMFIVPGRKLSYLTVDLSGLNAMLDCMNTTDFLKMSSNGLEVRCDVNTFESARCTFQIDGGCWYYEATVLTTGVMQIGWATEATNFRAQDGYGIGDDDFSLAYDGCRRLLWHKASPRHCADATPWVAGDVLGCLIDLDKQEAIFSLNGVRLAVCKDIFMSISMGFYAAASFMCFQGAQFNFGMQKFRYPPTDREFSSFNDHGELTDEEKQVIPRWLQIDRIQQEEEQDVEDVVCAICYDRTPNTILSPCRHKGFCHECAIRIPECPLCRDRVWYYSILPL